MSQWINPLPSRPAPAIVGAPRYQNVAEPCSREPIFDLRSAVIEGRRRHQVIEDVPEILRERIIRNRTKIIGVEQQLLQPRTLPRRGVQQLERQVQRQREQE